ncbi:MAG: four helix bundle protein [Melioribacteraceae bacterium]|nr:MAG: four helix bundle protein [Melioribacteraceae bacterium]
MNKIYDLEERTYLFAKDIYTVCKKIKTHYISFEYIDQVIRASGSIGANYIEANESLSKKDFAYRIKICRKEAKESAYWLKLLYETNENKVEKLKELFEEAVELKKIFSSIAEKSK